MSRTGKSTLLFVAVILGIYVAGDALTQGPLIRKARNLLADRQENTVARVWDHPISRSQLERAVREQLWLDGLNLESLTPEKQNAARKDSLDNLIDHELLRTKAAAIKVADDEIEARLKEFSARFKTPEEMADSMKSQGIASLNQLRNRLAAEIQQEKYIESKLAPLVVVTDEEARKWFAENRKQLGLPERIEARHIFIATLDYPESEAKAKLEAALAELTAKKKEFATLAKELSEDESSKHTGGALGWMTRDRLPMDFAAPVFSLPLHRPSLVRTKLGWHLVEVTARKADETRSFEDAKAEIVAALEALKRRQAAEDFRKSLRLSEAANIKIFHDRITP